MVSNYGLIFTFLLIDDAEHLSLCFFAIYISSLIKVSFWISSCFQNYVVFNHWVVMSLYILDTSSLTAMCSTNTFSYSVIVFYSLISFSDELKFLILVKFSWSVLSFMIHTFYILCKHFFITQDDKGFSPIFSSRSFTVLVFWFRPMIQFELIFVYGVRDFLLFVGMWASYCLAPFTERLSFHHSLTIAPPKNDFVYAQAYFWTSYSVSLMYLSILIEIPPCLDNYKFIVSLEIK